ncbi:Lead, cadmium, zinc and mercury transporting ATPase [Klebsiella pneumoniae subsp. rhinoscleromatis]|nr:Lead, cadmium, zinc and mercury transporting ATPase [Klebsiella pneumoniae subsp. rhinoscleromatis]
MRPATAPAESCCTDHACATESAPAAEALSDARYSWQVDGMDCAACARKVETAVRQVPGVSQVQVLFATEKLLVNAEGRCPRSG